MFTPIEMAMPAALPALNANGYLDVVARLRDWIVDERLPPGTPLPKQTELAQRFQVSNLTVGRAMRELQDDGFVVAIRRAGSFVAESAPHLHRYGLVLPAEVADWAQNRFLLALSEEAARLSAETEQEIVCYRGIDDHPQRAARLALRRDCQRRRLAGVIFASPPYHLFGEPAYEDPNLPRVAMINDQVRYPNLAQVHFRPDDFAHRTLRRFADLGRRRLAVLVNSSSLGAWEGQLTKLAPEYGLEWRPEWLQGCHLASPKAGRQIVRLLLSGSPQMRPDALLIADDNLIEEATAGIVDSGIDAARELEVIGMCNFPLPAPSSVPFRRLGYDAGELLRRCLRALQQQQRGEGAPSVSLVDALFQDEYDQRLRRRKSLEQGSQSHRLSHVHNPTLMETTV